MATKNVINKVTSKKMSDFVGNETEKSPVAKTYVVEWEVMIASSLLKGVVRVKSRDGKAKIQKRTRGTVFNALGMIGVSDIDTLTFKLKATDA